MPWYNEEVEGLSITFTNAVRDFQWEIALGVFVAYVCIDALAAWYTLMVTKLNPSKAALADFFIYILISFGVINYTRNFLYVLPMAVGGSLGTFLVVRWHRRRKKKPAASRAKRKRIH